MNHWTLFAHGMGAGGWRMDLFDLAFAVGGLVFLVLIILALATFFGPREG